ncbi:MAG: Cysteine synthase [Planctomycetes bacterium]|nr:Cysteine synthase [Planctomycetota bacterium]
MTPVAAAPGGARSTGAVKPFGDVIPHRLVACPRETTTCSEPSNVLDSIGWTPIIRLRAASDETGCEILGKCEYMNPGGSIKDRIAKGIIERAEARGALRRGMTILEVTSGNTGIALSMVGAVKGYRVVIVMPKTVSEERRHMVRSLGAELELIEELYRIQGAVAATKERARNDPSVFLPSQFENPDNPATHEATTGVEVLHQTGGRLDAFVMGVGTGGTVMGVCRAIRKSGSSAKVFALEPDESAVMSGGIAGHHGIQGLADGFVPAIVNVAELDGVVRVPTEDAKRMAARLSREEGLLVGISSGANVLGAMQVARRLGPGKRIVTMLCDRGERYLSLGLS